ncbi:MAG: hypothetical protein Q9191_003192 [Dirinaria sp. TL-2023a]
MTPDWNEAPKRLPYPAPKAMGTEAPIDASFTSAFAGGSLADVAGYLRNKPEIVDLDPIYFGLLDKQADWGKVVVCRLADPEKEEDGATCLLQEVGYSSLFLSGLDSTLDWNELIHLNSTVHYEQIQVELSEGAKGVFL